MTASRPKHWQSLRMVKDFLSKGGTFQGNAKAGAQWHPTPSWVSTKYGEKYAKVRTDSSL